MTATTDTLRRDSFTADAMNDLLDFVVRDRRFPELGIRGAIVIVLGRHLGVPPSEELVSLMARAFWDTWDDRLGELAGDTDDDRYGSHLILAHKTILLDQGTGGDAHDPESRRMTTNGARMAE